jgi:hypothetical protein
LAEESTELRVVDDEVTAPRVAVEGPTDVAVVTALALEAGTPMPATKRPKVVAIAANFETDLLRFDL